MTFKDDLATDLANIFLDTDEFAETVVAYQAGKAAGGAKSIVALVDRSGPEPFGLGDASELVHDAEVTIANDATTGLAQVTDQVTEFDLPLVLGGPVLTVRVIAIVSQDEGAWTVRVAK